MSPFSYLQGKVKKFLDKCRNFKMCKGLLVQTCLYGLGKHTSLSGRNISYDRLYTSTSLAKWLLERNITTAGTLQANGKGIPEEVKQIGSLDSNSYEAFWD